MGRTGVHIKQASCYERHVVEGQPRSCAWQGAARVFRCVIPGKRIESLNKPRSAKMVVGVHPRDCSSKLDIGVGWYLDQVGNCHLYGLGMARSVRQVVTFDQDSHLLLPAKFWGDVVETAVALRVVGYTEAVRIGAVTGGAGLLKSSLISRVKREIGCRVPFLCA